MSYPKASCSPPWERAPVVRCVRSWRTLHTRAGSSASPRALPRRHAARRRTPASAVAEAPWSVAEWAVALRFDNPRATVLVLLLSDTPLRVLGFQTPYTLIQNTPNALKTFKNTNKSSLISVLPLAPPTGGRLQRAPPRAHGAAERAPSACNPREERAIMCY